MLSPRRIQKRLDYIDSTAKGAEAHGAPSGIGDRQVACFVDMAEAGPLDVLGENRQALELVDRHP